MADRPKDMTGRATGLHEPDEGGVATGASPVTASRFKFNVRPTLRTSTTKPDEFTGELWDVTIIEAGKSLNGPIYTPEMLKAHVKLFEGVGIFAYEFDQAKMKNHLPKGVGSRAEQGLFGNMIGQLVNVKWDSVKRALVGQAAIDDELARAKLLNAWKRGSRDFAGVSIHAEGTKHGDLVTGFSNVKGLDLVTFPAAGGKFDRLVAGLDLATLEEGATLGAFIRARRNALEWTVEQAAEAVGEPPSVYKQIESGEIIQPERSCLEMFAKGMDLSIDKLMDLAAADKEASTANGGTNMADPVEGATVTEDQEQLGQITSIAEQIISGEATDPVGAAEEIKAIVEQITSADVAPNPNQPPVTPEPTEPKPMEAQADKGTGFPVQESKEDKVMGDTPNPTAAPVAAPVAAEPGKTVEELQASIDEMSSKFDEVTKENESLKTRLQDQAIEFELAGLSEEFKLVDREAVTALMDVSKITFTDEGKPEGLREAVESLLEAKPFLAEKKAEPRGQSVTIKESVQGDGTGNPYANKSAGALRARMEQLVPKMKAGNTKASVEFDRCREALIEVEA